MQLFPFARQGVETDERYTPRWLFDVMGTTFDLDPASPGVGMDHVRARRRYTVLEDGLAQPWTGLVWLNPPFSDPRPWVARWLEHGCGVLLFPWSVNADWRLRLLRGVDEVVTLEHLRFDSPTHTGRHVPVACALTAVGAGVPVLERVALRAPSALRWSRTL